MNSRYIPLTQQKYCCVPTCIQMVMYKNHIPLVSQEVIGNTLGLIVPEEDANLSESPRLGDRPKSGWGTQISKQGCGLNDAFSTLGIPLEAELRLIDEFESLEKMTIYLIDQQKLDTEILVCYDYSSLFSTNTTSGHVNVFDSIDPATSVVTLVDPEQRMPKYSHVPAEKLFTAMVQHGADNSAGFWKLSCI